MRWNVIVLKYQVSHIVFIIILYLNCHNIRSKEIYSDRQIKTINFLLSVVSVVSESGENGVGFVSHIRTTFCNERNFHGIWIILRQCSGLLCRKWIVSVKRDANRLSCFFLLLLFFFTPVSICIYCRLFHCIKWKGHTCFALTPSLFTVLWEQWKNTWQLHGYCGFFSSHTFIKLFCECYCVVVKTLYFRKLLKIELSYFAVLLWGRKWTVQLLLCLLALSASSFGGQQFLMNLPWCFILIQHTWIPLPTLEYWMTLRSVWLHIICINVNLYGAREIDSVRYVFLLFFACLSSPQENDLQYWINVLQH